MPPLLNVFCFCYIRTISVLFFVPIFAWCVSLVSVILLKRSLVFPILWFSLHCSLRKAFFSLLCYSLKPCIPMGISFLFSFAFCFFFFSAVYKPSSDNRFAFCISFSWGWFWPSSGRWRWTGAWSAAVLQSQRVGHDWATEQQNMLI